MLTAGEAELAGRKVSAEESLTLLLFLRRALRVACDTIIVRSIFALVVVVVGHLYVLRIARMM